MTNRTILLVDNKPEDLKRLTRQLLPLGYSFEKCTGTSAISERIRQTNPAVLLVGLDYQTSGGEPSAIKEVRRIFESGEYTQPIIFLADDYDLKMRLEAMRIGAKAFFIRPYSILDLVGALDRLLEQQSVKPFRVLIVDDNEPISKDYVSNLRQAGMEATALYDPIKLLDVISDFRPEIILMEQYIRGIEGRELCAIIRQEAAFNSIPIVFFSTETDPDKRIMMMKVGADEFLTKPITPKRLVTAISIRAERFRRLR